MPLCFATNNMHKLAEVRSLVHGKIGLKNLHDIGCEEELPETTGTIAGNARQKAEFVHAKYKMDCFADDSGLEVHALGNAPGVDSAIYAGPQRSHDLNIALLLSNLEKIYDRKARFLTVIALILEGKLFQFDGVLEGRILRSKRGDGGFGYDPVFVPDGSNKSLAEMSMEEKNKISHRAKAIGKLVAFLESNNRSL